MVMMMLVAVGVLTGIFFSADDGSDDGNADQVEGDEQRQVGGNSLLNSLHGASRWPCSEMVRQSCSYFEASKGMALCGTVPAKLLA